MGFERVFLVNRDGHRLAGRLDLPPDGQPVACALFAHCFTCTKNPARKAAAPRIRE